MRASAACCGRQPQRVGRADPKHPKKRAAVSWRTSALADAGVLCPQRGTSMHSGLHLITLTHFPGTSNLSPVHAPVSLLHIKPFCGTHVASAHSHSLRTPFKSRFNPGQASTGMLQAVCAGPESGPSQCIWLCYSAPSACRCLSVLRSCWIRWCSLPGTGPRSTLHLAELT